MKVELTKEEAELLFYLVQDNSMFDGNVDSEEEFDRKDAVRRSAMAALRKALHDRR